VRTANAVSNDGYYPKQHGLVSTGVAWLEYTAGECTAELGQARYDRLVGYNNSGNEKVAEGGECCRSDWPSRSGGAYYSNEGFKDLNDRNLMNICSASVSHQHACSSKSNLERPLSFASNIQTRP
jgi:hypothetical protein